MRLGIAPNFAPQMANNKTPFGAGAERRFVMFTSHTTSDYFKPSPHQHTLGWRQVHFVARFDIKGIIKNLLVDHGTVPAHGCR